ncbi:hypothetical protein GQ53DRAFT_741728 [Thozetella sp. PMI_491]|nr:hypothetical protein GQ53DRAFT_741728 [Thozetella sp. PMI_491]
MAAAPFQPLMTAQPGTTRHGSGCMMLGWVLRQSSAETSRKSTFGAHRHPLQAFRAGSISVAKAGMESPLSGQDFISFLLTPPF